jgi:hypothetical protein
MRSFANASAVAKLDTSNSCWLEHLDDPMFFLGIAPCNNSLNCLFAPSCHIKTAVPKCVASCLFPSSYQLKYDLTPSFSHENRLIHKELHQ